MVAFDAVGPSSAGTAFTATTGTWTHVNNGNGIFISITIFTGSANTVTAVTYGGVAIPLIKFFNATTTGGVAFYGLVGATCPTGSNTVSVTKTGTSNANAGSISVSAAGSLGTAVTFGDAAGHATASITVAGTTTGGLIISVAAFGGGSGGGVFSATAPNVLAWSHNGNNTTSADNGVGGTDPSTGGGASQTVTWNNTQSDNWSVIAVEVLPAAGGVSILPQQTKHRLPATFTRIIGRNRNAVYSR